MEDQREHRLNTFHSIKRSLNKVGIDTSKYDEIDFNYLHKLKKEYFKAAAAGAVTGALVGAPFGITAIPGAVIGAIAGIGMRANLSGVDTVDMILEKSKKDFERDFNKIKIQELSQNILKSMD